MSEAKYDLREIARAALGEMPEAKRGPFLTALLCEMDGPRGLELLTRARAAITFRAQELIDEQYPGMGLTAVPDQTVAAIYHPSGAVVPAGYIAAIDPEKSTRDALFWAPSAPRERSHRAEPPVAGGASHEASAEADLGAFPQASDRRRQQQSPASTGAVRNDGPAIPYQNQTAMQAGAEQ
ncbi:hypothetical protein [Paracoccus jiaweipingae]|uniref:hypothetical protein n=1 Tax=Paracoccus sp. p2-l61 TaxID=3366950 RepID=UPI0037A70016